MWVKLALLSCMGALINLVHTFITTFNSYFSSHRSYKVKGGLPVKKFWKKYSSSDNLICFYALCKKKKSPVQLLITSVFLNVYFTIFVSALGREIGNNNRALLPWLFLQKQKYNKLCCPVEGVKASPLQVM